ncbi:MAG: glycosyltransferase family 4 protein, partial [Anaerolineales bacterium]
LTTSETPRPKGHDVPDPKSRHGHASEIQNPKPVPSARSEGPSGQALSETGRAAIRNPQSAIRNPIPVLIPLGSNVEPQPPAGFDRAVWRRKYQANADTLLLAYFGFLNESKGGEELIEALALLRQQGLDARLLLIGGDVGHADPTNLAYARRVQALIDRHALTDFVYRTGYTGLRQVSANLLAADVVVMPYRDGVSFRRTTLIAALRHSCPVVSTIPPAPGLIPEIHTGQNMLLAPPDDALALAQTIVPLAGDPALRQKLAAGAKQLGHLFEWEKIAAETVELYRAAMQANFTR